MRTLKFVVEGSIIKCDPDCDFGGLVPGTAQYVKAEFSFSPEWNGYAKVVSFRSMMGKEYPPQELKGGRTCMIPDEALAKRAFKVYVMGKKNGSKKVTNKLIVRQDGGDA